MYRMWKGLDARFVLSVSGAAVSLIAVYIHIWAFSITGWPKTARVKYNPPAAIAP
jgi:hypothetical protein